MWTCAISNRVPTTTVLVEVTLSICYSSHLNCSHGFDWLWFIFVANGKVFKKHRLERWAILFHPLLSFTLSDKQVSLNESGHYHHPTISHLFSYVQCNVHIILTCTRSTLVDTRIYREVGREPCAFVRVTSTYFYMKANRDRQTVRQNSFQTSIT